MKIYFPFFFFNVATRKFKIRYETLSTAFAQPPLGICHLRQQSPAWLPGSVCLSCSPTPAPTTLVTLGIAFLDLSLLFWKMGTIRAPPSKSRGKDELRQHLPYPCLHRLANSASDCPLNMPSPISFARLLNPSFHRHTWLTEIGV